MGRKEGGIMSGIITIGDLDSLLKPSLRHTKDIWPINHKLHGSWYMSEGRNSFMIPDYKIIPFSEWVKSRPEYDDWLKEKKVVS